MNNDIDLYSGGGVSLGRIKENAELLADRLELPSDALAGTAKLTVNGRRRVLIENHSGIITYEDNMIAVNCGAMKAVIRGDNLSLGAMDKHDMLIMGRILNIEFE